MAPGLLTLGLLFLGRRRRREQDADLVVMGSRGRTGIARIILGSVSEKVASRAPVPVMVARGPAG